jgi:methylated-DNA-[protein]-cysteine S-methyltransferase
MNKCKELRRIYLNYYAFEIVKIGIIEDENSIVEIFFGEKCQIKNVEEKKTELIKEAVRQLEAYFAGTLQAFDLPLNPKVSPFQLSVLNIVKTIPYGETLSYKQVAELLGNPKAYRPVGMANRNNPISIVIPCHRVIGTDGKLVGYGGGLSVKRYLLDMEKQSRMR